MAGRFFDERPVGDVFTHEIRRTVTETDNLLFSTMTHNPQPLHQSMERLKALAEKHDAEIFFSHDSENYRHYLKAPVWYG